MELLYIILLFSVCILFINVHLFWRIKNTEKVHEGYSEAINAVNEVIQNNFLLLISWKKSTKRKTKYQCSEKMHRAYKLTIFAVPLDFWIYF